MNNKQVLSALLTAIIVLSIATSMAAATDDGGCPMESGVKAQAADDPLGNRIDDFLNETPVFLFFFADWCPFCNQQKPIIDQLEAEYAEGVTFIRINVTERSDHAAEFGVSGLPTMVVISGKDGAEYVREDVSGFRELVELREVIAFATGDEPGDADADVAFESEVLADRVVTPQDEVVLTAGNCGGEIVCECGDTVVLDYTLKDDLECAGLGLVVGADGIHIDGDGHTISGGGGEFSTGIKNNGYDYVTISNLLIVDFTTGIYLHNAANHNAVTDNEVSNCGDAISSTLDSRFNDIKRNYLHDNGCGVYMWSSHSNSVLLNTIDSNSHGIKLDDSGSNQIVSNAVCDNANYDIVVSGTGNYGDNFCDHLQVGSNSVTCSRSCGERGCVSDTDPKTVFKCGGTVTESCTFNFDLHCGAGGFLIGADNITINGGGYRLYGDVAINDLGIVSDGNDYCTIKNVGIRNFYQGIYLYDNANDNEIKGCSITNNDYGIDIKDSENNSVTPYSYFIAPLVIHTVYTNATSNNKNGIYLSNADGTEIRDSLIRDNDDSGIYMSLSDGTLLINNTIRNNGGNGIQMYHATTGSLRKNQITLNYYHGIDLHSSSGNVIGDNDIYDNYEHGINCLLSGHNNITANRLAENTYGIWLDKSDNNVIDDNELIYNYHQYNQYWVEGDGISINNSHFNRIENNTIDHNINGISVRNSNSTSIIKDNRIRNHKGVATYPSLAGNGIYVQNSENTSVKDNSVSNNFERGIYLDSATNTSIVNNSINDNGGDGMYLHTSLNSLIDKNKITKNNGEGIDLPHTHNTIITENYICGNAFRDIQNYGPGVDNIGWLNYCDKTWLWVDNGSSSGCMYSCGELNCTDGDGDGYYQFDVLNCPIGNDCNDKIASVNPGASEIYCNGVDEDCSGADDCTCPDKDNDGAPGKSDTCPIGIDCDDTDSSIYPGAKEINCNGVDEDCDGKDQCACTDNDKDGYALEGGDCSLGGEVDCNDNSPNIHPNAAEIYCNGVDEDCRGGDDCTCVDKDGDGYPGTTPLCPTGTDCDDLVKSINPGAAEICYNWIDENCNGMTNEGCSITCTTDADCSGGRVCKNNLCECPNGQIHDLYINGGNVVCDPVGHPVDTPCTNGWPYHEGPSDFFGFNTGFNENVPACDLYEVNRSMYYANGLLPSAERARDCCVNYHLTGNVSPGCHKGYTKRAYTESGLATALNYDNMRRCIGLYEIYALGPGKEYMQGYYQNEIDCGHDQFAGFGSGCLGSTWIEDCCINDDHWYCTVSEVSCYDGVHEITKKLKCQEDVGTPSGWTTDYSSDMYYNGCCFSDLPAHASIAFLSTGTCVDYSVVLTTLLRLSGYKNNEVYSARSDCPEGGHAFNLIKFPGDSKYTLVDTVGNCGNGYKPNRLPRCNGCYYWGFEQCQNDLGRVGCPPNSLVYGAEWAGEFRSCLNKIEDLPGCKNDTTKCLNQVNEIKDCADDHGCGTEWSALKTCVQTKVNSSTPLSHACNKERLALNSCVFASGTAAAPGPSISPENASLPQDPTFTATSATGGNITVTRTVFENIYFGELIRVSIAVENTNDYPVDVIIKESITGAFVYDTLIIPDVSPDAVAPPMPYMIFSDTILSHSEKSFMYSVLPEAVGPYIHSSTKISGNDNILFYIDTQTTEVNCISDGVCDGSIGENYITCPQDCWSGAEDGICNPIADGQCDRDCAEGMDPDCQCVTPTDDLYINSDTTLCHGVYNIPDAGVTGVIIINAADIVLDCNGATLKGDDSGCGIFNPGFDNVTIRNGNVLNYETGIQLFESDNSTISNNTISHSSNQGISIEGSQYCDVCDNRASFSGDRGITFGGGGNNTVYNNIVHNNSAYGAIEAIYSDNNEIYNNTAYFNQWGIATNHGSNNLIHGNTIYGNELGVYMDWPSTNNRVLNNEISSNGEGVRTNHNSTGNLILGNLVFSNDDAGMHIETDDNTLSSNTANNNLVGLHLGINSSGNVVTGNIFCSNLIYDIQDEGSNSGDDNTCDLTGTWNDSETTGCTYSCPPSECSGDLNRDGKITTTDAMIALDLAARGEYDPAADVNCDEHVTVLDALMILQAAAGNIELQGCES